MQKFKFLSKDNKKDKKNAHDNSEAVGDALSITSSERKLISRNAVICSSGKDKHRYDSERAELPSRPVDIELDGNSLLVPSSNHYDLSRTNSRISSVRSLCSTSLDISSPVPLSPVGSVSGGDSPTPSQVVKRDTVVNSFDLQPSVFENGKFHNPWPDYKAQTFTSILKLGFSPDKSNVSSKQELNSLLPIVEPKIKSSPPADAFRVTWLGHATILAEFDNIAVLTDPIFSDRASPSQVIGPKRYRDPPCTIHDLPSNLDAVVISHSHYDHLDLNSVVILNARFGSDLRWFIPLGLADWFNSVGCENVVELDWWEENCVADKSDVSFVFTPSQHWSKRTLTDENKTLWGSWVIKGPNFRFFFAGDTGYCSIFKQIGLVYGPFNVAAIPIGAYEPRWFMKHQHVNPEEAVRIHQDLQSIFSIAIHWGTFALSNEYFLDPPRLLREALEKRRVNLKDFVTFKHGETQIIPKKGGNSSVQHQHQQQQQQHQQQLQLQQTPWNMSASMFMNSNHLPNQTPFMVADPTTISSPIIQSQNRK